MKRNLQARRRTPLKMAVGAVLRKRRLAIGISQENLALTADVDRTYVSEIELGLRAPSLTILTALCDALRITLSAFVTTLERDHAATVRDACNQVPARKRG